MDSAINQLEKMYKDEVIEYAERVGPGDDEIFAHSFHKYVYPMRYISNGLKTSVLV